MVHVALDFVRKPPQNYICYLMFTLSECWVLAFCLAKTEGSTVFLFAVTLTSQVLAISLFLMTDKRTFARGIVALLTMTASMFTLSYMTLNYTDILTISVCMLGGLLFGIFLLSKAF
jgi:hypothetical protein